MLSLKDNEVYKYNKKNGFELFDPLQYKYNGYTIEHLYKLNKKREEEKAKITEYQNKLSKIVSGNTLSEQIDNLLSESLIVLEDEIVKGRIKRIQPYKGEDIAFLKISDGKIVRDKNKERLLL